MTEHLFGKTNVELCRIRQKSLKVLHHETEVVPDRSQPWLTLHITSNEIHAVPLTNACKTCQRKIIHFTTTM